MPGEALFSQFLSLALGAGCLLLLAVVVSLSENLRRLRRDLAWLEWRCVPPDLPGRVLLVILASFLFLAVSVSLARQFGWDPEQHPIAAMSLGQCAVQALPLFYVWYLLRQRRLPWKSLFGWYRVHSLRHLVHGVHGFLITLPLVLLMAWVSHLVLLRLGLNPTPQEIFDTLAGPMDRGRLVLVVFLTVVLAPVAEEVLFRGILFPWLAKRIGPVSGMLVSSAVFASLHVSLSAFVPLFTLAIGLCLTYAVKRSLPAVIWFHACFNALNLVKFWVTEG